MDILDVLKSRLAGLGLTGREVEVALLVVRGLSNREISKNLLITEQTVKDHLSNVYRKALIHRRSELAARVLGLDV